MSNLNERSSRANGSATKVLVVEDAQKIVKLIKEILRPEGYEVIVAEDGEQGVECARELKPDIVLLDLMLPTLDEFQVHA